VAKSIGLAPYWAHHIVDFVNRSDAPLPTSIPAIDCGEFTRWCYSGMSSPVIYVLDTRDPQCVKNRYFSRFVRATHGRADQQLGSLARSAIVQASVVFRRATRILAMIPKTVFFPFSKCIQLPQNTWRVCSPECRVIIDVIIIPHAT